MITTRRFRIEDVPYVAAEQMRLNTLHQGFDYFYYDAASGAGEEFSSYVSGRLEDPNFCLLVAEHDSQVAGYIMGWVDLRPPIYVHRKVGYLSNIHVSPQHRGLGIGERLHVDLEDWLIDKEVDFLEMHVDVRNPSVIEYHKARGYGEVTLSLYRRLSPTHSSDD